MENQQQPSPNLCRANCGFYGAPQFEDYCSKCYKDVIKRKQQAPNSTTMVAAQRHSPTNIGTASTCSDATQTPSDSQQIADEVQQQQASSAPSHIPPMSVAITTNVADSAKNENALMETSTGIVNDIEAAKKIDVDTQISSNPAPDEVKSPTPTPVTNPVIVGGEQSSTVEQEKPKKPPNRCHECNKKVGLTGIPCRCGGIYCSEHRYSQSHGCTFDYKTVEREGLRKANPVVVSDKIERI